MKREIVNRRRGVLITELMLSLLIAVALLMAMTVLLAQQRKAERRLGEVRAASRQLEMGLVGMQGGASAGPEIVVERVTGPAPAGRAWVRLTMKGGRGARLVGLVPESAAGRDP